jgi:signal transduction histidine kinase
MRRNGRIDAVVALGFVLAAVAEAALRYHSEPARLAFNATGALWLAVLVLRRRRPAVAIGVIAAGGVAGTLVTAYAWPHGEDSAGVWIVALLLAAYSVGAYGSDRALALGALLPFAVVSAADLTTRSGWSRISGMVFVTVFIGLLPTTVGRVVRVRNGRVRMLQDQHERIAAAQRAQQASAVIAERLRTVERLQPGLVEGLQSLAAAAEAEAAPADVEAEARTLLARTREEVLALTEPVDVPPVADLPPADHVAALRRAAQPWAALVAAAVAAGLYAEGTRVLDVPGSAWVALASAVAVGAPLALAWARPMTAVVLGYVAVAAYSRLLAPLDGTLSETGFALAAAFTVAALLPRRRAAAGLAVCVVGQLAGVGTSDLLGGALLLVLSWLGGLAVNEASRLVEQSRTNNELLRRQEDAAATRAVVEERLRLAREIHDALGHSLTVVALQAGAARRLTDGDPERARAVMQTVAAAARSGVASLAPERDDADVAALVERVAATGLSVEADLGGQVELDPQQRLVAFRVVQEGLTNVLRHAPGARTNVVIRRRGDQAEVLVVNSAPTGTGSQTGEGAGRGLAGLRERVAAAAGHVTWRGRDDGGFELRALLPLPARMPVA